MDKIKQYLLLSGLLLALLCAFVTINPTIQLIVFGVIIAITGVPHGALDYFVEEQTLAKASQRISITRFLTKYFLNMLLYAIVWFVFPTLALLLFILLTAYHFGEIDWPMRQYLFLDSVCYTVYGLLFILFIITRHIGFAAPILYEVVRHQISIDSWLFWGNIVFKYSLWGLAFQLFLIAILYKKIGWTRRLLVAFLVQSLVLTAIIYTLPLYLGFGFYFGVWHSVLSFNLIRRQMHLPNTVFGWLILIKKALPFSIIAWSGILLLLFFQSHTPTEWLAVSNLFVGIAVLTLPHLQVFTKIKLR